jgi:methionine-S-sulfoxide reductase
MFNKLVTPILIGTIALLGAFLVLNYDRGLINFSEPSSSALIPPIDRSIPAELETATFALGCFWAPDARFGSTLGVVRTRVGYAGGTQANPTYKSIGDHTETVQIDYNPGKVTYGELLDIFWESHDPSRQSGYQQYKSIIFYDSEDQRTLAHESRVERESELNRTIYTEIKPLTGFYAAEDYHQKYRLQQEKELMKEFRAMYTNMGDFVDSTAAARVNGYLSGYGDPDILQGELSRYGLTESGAERLFEAFNERKGYIYC